MKEFCEKHDEMLRELAENTAIQKAHWEEMVQLRKDIAGLRIDIRQIGTNTAQEKGFQNGYRRAAESTQATFFKWAGLVVAAIAVLISIYAVARKAEAKSSVSASYSSESTYAKERAEMLSE